MDTNSTNCVTPQVVFYWIKIQLYFSLLLIEDLKGNIGSTCVSTLSNHIFAHFWIFLYFYGNVKGELRPFVLCQLLAFMLKRNFVILCYATLFGIDFF
jgi:hypothetical protein